MALKDKILVVAGGPHVAAVATIDGTVPAVRYMVLSGFPDMTFIGGTMTASRKVRQLKKRPEAALAIWSGKEYSDPYVVIRARGEVHEDTATKKKYWNPVFQQHFRTVDNPEFVVLVFKALEIEYHDPKEMTMEIWKR